MTGDLHLNIDRNKHNLHEFSVKEEELVVVRVELANLHEKYKAKIDEVRKLFCKIKIIFIQYATITQCFNRKLIIERFSVLNIYLCT